MGSWASITADLISFYRSKGREFYTKIANTLDYVANSPEHHQVHSPHPAVDVLLTIFIRVHAFLESIPNVEFDFFTSLVISKRNVEIPLLSY